MLCALFVCPGHYRMVEVSWISSFYCVYDHVHKIINEPAEDKRRVQIKTLSKGDNENGKDFDDERSDDL